MWCEFTRGERLSGSGQLVSLRFRSARNRPQQIRSAVAVATLPPGLSDNVYLQNYACGYGNGRNHKSTVIYSASQVAQNRTSI